MPAIKITSMRMSLDFFFSHLVAGLSNSMLWLQSPVQQLLRETIQVANGCSMSQQTFVSSKV
jgi:hypothetical protein